MLQSHHPFDLGAWQITFSREQPNPRPRSRRPQPLYDNLGRPLLKSRLTSYRPGESLAKSRPTRIDGPALP
jgi:hypothetical protein